MNLQDGHPLMRHYDARFKWAVDDAIGRVDNDLKAAIADLKSDMKLLKFGYGPAILGFLIKLVFFP